MVLVSVLEYFGGLLYLAWEKEREKSEVFEIFKGEEKKKKKKVLLHCVLWLCIAELKMVFPWAGQAGQGSREPDNEISSFLFLQGQISLGSLETFIITIWNPLDFRYWQLVV